MSRTLVATDSKEDKRQLVLKENKYEEITVLLDAKKLEEDYRVLYKKVWEVFPRFDSKLTREPGVSVHRNLIYQVIYTIACLLQMAALDFRKERKKWLTDNFASIVREIEMISANIKAADPILHQEVFDQLLKKESPEAWTIWLLKRAEDIFSLAGSAVRDLGKLKRQYDSWMELIKTITPAICENNAIVLVQVEDYQLYLRETIFFRDIGPTISAHNRLETIKKIDELLEKRPDQPELLARKEKLVNEQKEFEQKEREKSAEIGQKMYAEILRKRKIRLPKALAKMDIDLLKGACHQVAEDCFFWGMKLHALMIYKIELVEKELSKTFDMDHAEIKYEDFQLQIKIVRATLFLLKSDVNDAMQGRSELSETKHSTGLMVDDQELERQLSGHLGDLLEKMISGQQHGVLERDLEITEKKLGEVRVRMKQKAQKAERELDYKMHELPMRERFLKSDYKSITVVKALYDEYHAKKKAILRLSSPRKENLNSENDKAYLIFMGNVLTFFLSCPIESRSRRIFGFDKNDPYTSVQLKNEFNKLSLIFHPDKLGSQLGPERSELCKQFAQILLEIRRELKENLSLKAIGEAVEKHSSNIIEQIVKIHGWLESIVSVGKMKIRAREPNIFSESLSVNGRGSCVSSTATTLKLGD